MKKIIEMDQMVIDGNFDKYMTLVEKVDAHIRAANPDEKILPSQISTHAGRIWDASKAEVDITSLGSKNVVDTPTVEVVVNPEPEVEYEEPVDPFTKRKSPAKHDKHKEFWDEWGELFLEHMQTNKLTLSEIVDSLKPYGLTDSAVRSKADWFGYGVRGNKFYKKSGV